MEYANGGSLNNCLKKYLSLYKRAFPEEIIQHLMKQIVMAVAYMHSCCVIHRDLKADNIMVHFDSENDKQVTIRERDSMEQVRIPIDGLKKYFEDNFLNR